MKSYVIGSLCVPLGALPDGAELRNVERDFFFLNPLKSGEKRPDDWDRYVRENDGDVVRYFWPSAR